MKKHSSWLLSIATLAIAGSFLTVGTNNFISKKEALPATIVGHVYNAVDNNSVTVGKILLIYDTGTGNLTAGVYDGSGPTCIDYANEVATGSISQLRGSCTANSVYITYNYPGGGSGSINLNGAIDCGGIICD